MIDPTPARIAHYGDFFANAPRLRGPLLLVLGNCQAESLRLLLDPAGERSVRVPPVFELTADDVPRLRALLHRTGVLVTQAVVDGYRGLAVGTEQLSRHVPSASRTVRVPVVRYAGLHPCHVVHHPPDGVAGPPVVPYHDLRVLARALGVPVRADVPGEEAVRAVGAASVAELARREAALDVAVSDALVEPRPGDVRTPNHPGDRLLHLLAVRVAAAAGLPEPAVPTRPLLDAVVAPLDPVVARAWGHPPETVRAGWRVDGREVPAAEVEAAHLAWYAEHPTLAREVWERFTPTARLLGMVP